MKIGNGKVSKKKLQIAMKRSDKELIKVLAKKMYEKEYDSNRE